jgi:hypothetical protein
MYSKRRAIGKFLLARLIDATLSTEHTGQRVSALIQFTRENLQGLRGADVVDLENRRPGPDSLRLGAAPETLSLTDSAEKRQVGYRL